MFWITVEIKTTEIHPTKADSLLIIIIYKNKVLYIKTRWNI